MKVLLVQCPCSYGIEMPALGLAYLSSFLKANSYDVSILDLSVLLYKIVDEDNRRYWESNNGYCWYLEDSFRKLPFLTDKLYEDFVQKILSKKADVLGFSVQNTSVLFTLEIIGRIRRKDPSVRIILGGPHCYNISGNNNKFRLHYNLHKFANAVVVGEGEKSLLGILKHLETGKPLDDCKGVAHQRDQEWVLDGFSDPVLNLDDLPFPDFTDYDFTVYKDKNALPILTSRGCVMKCVFCTDTHFWSPFRYRSPENVLKEITSRQEVYGNNFFNFNDSLMNGNYRSLLGICKLLIDKKVDIHWGGNFRVGGRIGIEFLKVMKQAGCEYLVAGIESASDKVLQLMGKKFNIKEAQLFIEDCNSVGIDVMANWIVGFPGETEEDFMKTAKFIEEYSGLIKQNTFTTLTINQFSYLEKHKEEFDVILDGGHLGLWRSADGLNTIEVRTARLRYLENIEAKRNKRYNVVRQNEQ